METRDDSGLMRAVAKGEEAAFVALFRRYQRAIFRFACRMTGSPETAEDLTQECFVRVLRSAGSFQAARGTVRVYLYATARNLALREMGRRRPGTGAEDEEAAGELADGTLGAEEALLALEASEVVERAVWALPAPQREALVLVEYEDLTLEETADILGIDAGAVKSRLHRARANLKKLLAPYFGRERMNDGSFTG